MKTYIEPGIYTGLSNDDYHAATGISKSGLDLVARCPALYKNRYIDGNVSEPTPAMILGSALHAAVLEPDLFDGGYVMKPDCDRRTKAGKTVWTEFLEQAGDRTILDGNTWEKVLRMRDAVLSHPKAAEILKSGQAETSVFHRTEYGDMIKVRPDWMVDDVLVDLKTVNDAGMSGFSKSCLNFRYHVQSALYLDAASAEMRISFTGFLFICVEKIEPYQVAVYTAHEDMVNLGRRQYLEDLALWRACNEANYWPGYNDDEIATVSLPGWAFK